MKFTLKPSKPRNRFVVAGLRRQAGAHTPINSVRRRQAKSDLRQEIDRLKPSP